MSKKILVVDDQAQKRAAKAKALKMLGCHVDEAPSGIDALKRFIADNYDVILMDYDAPFMSGPECAQKIREYENGTATKAIIIGVADRVSDRFQERCLSAGMDFCLKESSTEVLLDMVKEIAMSA